MSRPDRRASRPLIIVLLLAVTIGAICIVQKLSGSAPVDQQAAAATPAPGSPVQAAPVQAAPAAASAVQPTQNTSAPPMIPSPEMPVVPLPVVVKPSEPTTQPMAAEPADKPVAAEPADAPVAAEPADAPVAVLASHVELGTTTAPSPSTLAQAKSDLDAGNVLSARSQLNNALQSGQMDATQTASAKAMISQISQSVVFGRQHFPDDPYGGTYVVQPGETLGRIAQAHDTTWEFLSRINGIDPKMLRSGATIKIVQGPFFAVVDKKKFTMDIYLGGLPGEKSSMYVTTYPVGLGRDDSTPVGTWIIEPHRKLKHPTYYSPRGEGVIAADDPKNPLGGFWIGLTGTQGQAIGKLSYGIHGTIDPDSIGKQESMGCIRLKAEDIAVVFDLMVEGKSLVMVQG